MIYIYALLLALALGDPGVFALLVVAKFFLQDFNKTLRRYGARERGRRAWWAR